LIFLDLFELQNDSLNSYEHLVSSKFQQAGLKKEITAPGVYKLLIQPEIAANTPFRLKIFKEPVYHFPVASKGNSSVQSFWGADRDAGRRRHEGIDIFAKRGTPVVAATAGRVSSTGNKGLGGKQVWLRDRERGNSLYYAHLDSIIATPGMKVEPGDTLGLVGNTGNARTTAPHLHFGIYKSYRGAQNPLPYVYLTEKPEEVDLSPVPDSGFIVSKATANLRKGPSTKFEIGAKIKPQDTLRLLGETDDWYHARLENENFFIHKSLASPL
jgi:murein DD-endopeptidase MepM/ murein hydrolase activator NlpD